MIEQHDRFDQVRDEMTEARTARGREMAVYMGMGEKIIVGYDGKGRAEWEHIPSADWLYHHDRRKKLSSSERATFDLEFIKARGKAGVRVSVDLALAEMRKKLMGRLGKPSWRAG